MMLTEVYKRNNVPLTDLFGVAYPSYFVHPVAEYRALVQDAGVIDLSHCSVLRLRGRDRATFLNAMITNEVSSLPRDRGCHSLITTIKGKIIAELYVFAREDDILVIVSQGDAAATWDTLHKHIISEDVIVEDLSSQFGVLAVEGPKSYDILWRMFSNGPFPKEPMQAVTREFHNVTMYLMANSVTRQTGYHLMIPATNVERMRNFLVQAARGSDGLPVGSIAWHMRRVEMGIPWHGIDYTEDNFPDESRLGAAISHTKGCFRGHETLARLHHRGHVNRVLVGLTTDENSLPESVRGLARRSETELHDRDEAALREKASATARALDLTSLFAPNAELLPRAHVSTEGEERWKPIGRITSVAYSPVLGRPLLLGYVRREVSESGEDVVLNGGPTLSLVDLPLS